MTKTSIGKWLVDRDIFGQPITVLYKGSDVYRTKMGCCITFGTFILLLINFVGLSTVFLDGSRQKDSV